VNSIYSHYLAQEFIRKVHQGSQGVNERPQVLAENGIQEKRQVHEKSQVLDERQTNEQINEKKSRVLLWTTNVEVPHADVMRALGVDWVFFAGAPANCLIITRQVREIWKDPAKPPPLLLGDGCVSDELLPQAGPRAPRLFSFCDY
jgi:hypothetical protein